jgi:hypothetical protein
MAVINRLQNASSNVVAIAKQHPGLYGELDAD